MYFLNETVDCVLVGAGGISCYSLFIFQHCSPDFRLAISSHLSDLLKKSTHLRGSHFAHCLIYNAL